MADLPVKEIEEIITEEEQEELDKWFRDNLVYCEDTHSFVHRLFDKIKSGLNNDKYKFGPDGESMEYNKNDAQNDAFEVMKEMRCEYDEKKRKKP